MKKDEILKVLHYLNTYYNRRFELPEDKSKLKMMVETWRDFLAEYQYEIIKIALKKLISHKKWPPTPGEIVNEIEKIKDHPENKLTAGEAWRNVLQVIRKHGVLYGTEAVEQELPPRALKAAECVGGLRAIGMSNTEDTYLMNRYCQIYDELTKQDIERKRLPESIRKETAELVEKYTNPQIEGD